MFNLGRFLLAMALIGVCSGSVLAQQENTVAANAQASRNNVGVLLMAHGGSPEWNAAVNEAAQPLQKQCPLVVAFGGADRESLQKGVAELEAQGVERIAVVRLFISGASFLHQTEYVLGLRPDPPAEFSHHQRHGGRDSAQASSAHVAHQDSKSRAHAPSQANGPAIPLPIETNAQLVVSRPGLIDAEEVAQILYERVAALSTKPENESVLFLAHGMGDDRENEKILNRTARLTHTLAGLGRFRAIAVETLREDWPEKRKAAEERIRDFIARGHENNGRVIVVPMRLFGFGPYKEVLTNLDYVADGLGLLPHPLITAWIQKQAEACCTSAGWPSPFGASPVQN